MSRKNEEPQATSSVIFRFWRCNVCNIVTARTAFHGKGAIPHIAV